jgi:hypothetical protein
MVGDLTATVYLYDRDFSWIQDVFCFACQTLRKDWFVAQQPNLVTASSIGLLNQITHGFPDRFIFLQSQSTDD